jgi:hypothetical protein
MTADRIIKEKCRVATNPRSDLPQDAAALIYQIIFDVIEQKGGSCGSTLFDIKAMDDAIRILNRAATKLASGSTAIWRIVDEARHHLEVQLERQLSTLTSEKSATSALEDNSLPCTSQADRSGPEATYM